MLPFPGYDCHLVVQALSSDPRITEIKALPRNTEKFRTLQINSFHFLDSMSFLDGSLADVVDDLTKSGHPFKFLDQSGIYTSAQQKELLLQKGIHILSSPLMERGET
jgi:hypothetical protein